MYTEETTQCGNVAAHMYKRQAGQGGTRQLQLCEITLCGLSCASHHMAGGIQRSVLTHRSCWD